LKYFVNGFKHFTFLFLLLFVAQSFASKVDLKIIKTIGDERDEYFFYQIGDVHCSADKNIYVADVKGRSISKFSWGGNFLKKKGNRGQGPGDFSQPIEIDTFKNIVNVYDRLNFRISSLNTNLETIELQKLNKHLFMNVYFLNTNIFLGIKAFNFRTKSKNLVNIFDKSESIKYSFFNNKRIVDMYSDMDIRDLEDYSSFFFVSAGVSNDKKCISVSQKHIVNPLFIYIYNTTGQLINEFSYRYKNNYQFINIRSKKRNLKPFINTVDSIFILEKFIVVHIVPIKNRNASKAISEVNHFLIFDSNGKYLLRKNIDKRFGKKFYQLTDDMYLIGSKLVQDVEKVIISKIRIEN